MHLLLYPMIQQESYPYPSEDTTLNIVYNQYPDQNSFFTNTAQEEMDLDLEQTNEEKVERLTQERYPIEERIHLIINKQTGQVYDTRNDTTVDNLLKSTELFVPNGVTQGSWNDYWKKVGKAKEDFIEAACMGDIETMDAILKSNNGETPIDVNFRSFDNWTALHYSALHVQIDVMEYILKNKGDVNVQTRFGWSTLHIASKKNLLSCSFMLLGAGADPNLKDLDEYTALHYAAENGDKPMIELLLKFNADYKLKNSFGRTAKDCSVNADTFGVFPCDTVNVYGKVVIEGVLIPNGRADDIERLLNARKNEDGRVQRSAIIEEKSKTRFVNMIKMYKALSNKEDLSTDDFHFYRRLGRGAFGEVWLARKVSDNVDRMYAIKILNKDKIVGAPLERYIKTQKDVLSLISHPFLVRLYYSFQNQSRLFLVMQFCQGGDMGMLLNKKRKFPEQLTKYYTCEIILALQALHKNMIIYRDLKPDNLIIDKDGHVMITDFGLSKKLTGFDKMSTSFCGTPAYMPLEILDKKGHNRMADWYTLGVVIYQFLTGLPPFYANTREELFKNKREHILKLPKGISEECKDILKQLLQKDCNRRLGIERDGESIREHPWFKGIDWQKVYNRQLVLPKPDTQLVLGSPVKLKTNQVKEVRDLENWSFAV